MRAERQHLECDPPLARYAGRHRSSGALMSNDDPIALTPEEFQTMLDLLAQDGHAAHAIWVASRLEESVGELIRLYMPNLSNRLRERLFKGYGPLSSFSAKIDIAYALDLIPEGLRRDLHAIRDIRNEFAHTSERLHFDTPKLKALLGKFADYDQSDGLSFYVRKLDACLAIVRPQAETLASLKALDAALPMKPRASRGKPPSPSPRRQPRAQGGSDKGE